MKTVKSPSALCVPGDGSYVCHEGHQARQDQRPSWMGQKILDFWGPLKRLLAYLYTSAAEGLCRWIKAMEVYVRVAKVTETPVERPGSGNCHSSGRSEN